jgi:hypothetical protein
MELLERTADTDLDALVAAILASGMPPGRPAPGEPGSGDAPTETGDDDEEDEAE